MGKQTHTPGPWVIQTAKTGDTHSMIRAALPGYSGTRKIAEVTDIGSPADANAHLIAAAPELLAALREMLAVHDDNVEQGRVRFAKGSFVHRAAKKARAAIAKATAEQEA